MIVGPHSTKLPQSRDTESDQLGVPASFKPLVKGMHSITHGAPFEAPRFQWFPLVLLGIGTLGRRVAPLSVSTHIRVRVRVRVRE